MIDSKIVDKMKIGISSFHACPICGEKIDIGVENSTLNSIDKSTGIYTHILLHGYPLHALIIHIDLNGSVRAIKGCSSIEIQRDNATLTQLIKKWSNPY